MSKIKTEHIRVTGKDGKLCLKCFNCGKEELQDMPASVEAVNSISKAFTQNHKGCKKK